MNTSDHLFSFDIGTNSIGWAILRLDKQGEPSGIVEAGVRIFSDGRDPKTRTSLAEGRRMARAMSRRRDRYKRRRKATLRTLVEYGLMPAAENARKALLKETSDQSDEKLAGGPRSDPYNLRLRALTEKLPLAHLGRALFHLNQRRGFKSNRKTDKKSNEKGAIEMGVDRLRAMMAETMSPTLGAFLAMRRAAGQPVRVRGGAPGDAEGEESGDKQPNANRTAYDFYPDRALLESEFDMIWAAQAAHHPDVLTDERRAHLRKVMFHQRPLKPAVVGKCSFNPEEPRLPKAHPLFQRFRLYKEINELELVLEDQSHRKLSLEQRDLLIKQLRTQASATFTGLRRTLKLTSRAIHFNKESESRTKLLGDLVAAALSDGKCFGPRWFDFSLDEQWKIVERLREEQDPDVLREWLETEYGLSGEAAKTVADVNLPEGYGRLGKTALTEMLVHLEADVIPESRAAELADYDHTLLEKAEGLDRLPKYQEVLERRIPPGTGNKNDPYDVEKGRITNPTVHIGMNQLRRLVNAMIGRFGRPERIAIELARELNLSDEEKSKINREIAVNTREAIRRGEKLKELGQRDNGANRLLLKLWEELNPGSPEDRCCIYTGRAIGIGLLFSGAVDVDHILPWSRTLDDGQGNRILCMREANREKGDRAPAEVPQWAAHYDQILERANRLPPNKRWRFARDAMQRFEKNRDFLARQLTDTQYLARLAHDYLGSLYADEEPDADGVLFKRNHVIVATGRMTEMLRRAWELNALLPDHNFAETVKGKNRKDHRHHAIDAAVIGVTTRSLLQRIATASGKGEAVGVEDALRKIEKPWPSFREDLAAVVQRIVVSHKPDHGTLPKPGAMGGTAGKLHNDTAYGLIEPPLPRGDNVVRRVPLLSLRPQDIADVRDDELRARLDSAVSGLTGKEFEAALLHFARNDARFKGIRHVRVTEKLNVIPIRDRQGKAYKGYLGDANYRYDVWETKDGRWLPEVISMYDAHQPGWSSKIRPDHPTARKVLSLHQNDMVAYVDPRQGPVIGRVVKFGLNGQITLVAHNEAGDLTKRNASTDDPFKYYAPTAGGLKKIQLRQIRIDETGRVFDPGPQDRESRAARGGAAG
ncbi:MAG: type II CRISPR RNA-guided endonuclease Cas9 [Cucumibacter sp.]